MMPNNLQLYHKMKRQLCQWLPSERSTRIENMTLLLTGLYLSGQVHLAKIVRKWPLPGKQPSLTHRLWRFLNNPRLAVRRWYGPVVTEILARVPAGPLYLIIDSTKVGFDYRLVSIGLAFKKRTLPLIWHVRRGRKGHTTVAEQVQLFKQLYPLMPTGREIWVIADTEFQGVDLLRWLRRQGWHFVIRQQGKIKVTWAGQAHIKINALDLHEGQTHVIGWVRLTAKHDVGWFWLVLHWKKGEEEPWYLVCDRNLAPRTLLRIYRKRMWVEEMYGDMKGHGFDLETTHLKCAQRIARLFLAVSIVFVWLISLGSWVVKRGYRHFVDHRSRRDKSYFRIGWDWVERCLGLNQPFSVQITPFF
jgi:hypothetical protein